MLRVAVSRWPTLVQVRCEDTRSRLGGGEGGCGGPRAEGECHRAAVPGSHGGPKDKGGSVAGPLCLS